jgi:hypothetical protein
VQKPTIKFNQRGHLSQTHKISFKDFEYNFVTKSGFYKKPLIFKEFMAYLIELAPIIQQESIKIWVNGSFVTDETEPKDIDFVIFVEKSLPNFSKLVDFTKNFEYMDVYFIPCDDEKESYDEWVEYWKYSFSHSKHGLHKKGFLKLEIKIKDGLIFDV